MRDRIAALVFVFAACGAEVEPSVDPTPSPLAATTRGAADAPAALTIGGRLRAHDGAPLRAAEFTIHRSDFTEPYTKGPLADDGSFRVEVAEPGVYFLSVAAVDHAQLAQLLLVERAVEVEGALGTYARTDPGEALRIKSQWLGADGTPVASGPTAATRTIDGVHRVDLKDRPSDAVRLRYQLVGDGGRTYNGPLADSHESDGGGDYWSVVTLDGRDAMELDLTALPPAGRAAQLTWRGEPPELSALRAYRDAWRPKFDRLSASMPRTDGKLKGDDARVAELYTSIRAPRFAGTYTAKRLAERFDPDRLLQRGRPFPDFAFPALAADAPPITRAGRAGRLYLVEFWATWCGPCVADMPDLHATYAAVNGARPGKGKGEDGMRRLAAVDRPKIEFVFVSLDQNPDDVRAFRDKHWSMPWTHAFVGRDGEKEVMARYGFSGVPTAILVDGDGTIVEVGAALRRERLLPALERALAAVRAPAP